MVEELAAFYRGKTVFVTGHTGFKGGWLSVWLQEMGARVVGYSLAPEHGPQGFFDAARVADKMISLTGDIRDRTTLEAAIQEHRPDLLFHLAAQALVLRSYREPIETLASNVMGTAHVLESARRVPALRSIVVATSDKCYAAPDQERPRQEEDPLGGVDPYSASKGAAEIVIAAYRASYFGPDSGVGLASVRAGNVIGGGDWAEARLLPDCMRALAAGTDVVVRNPRSTRPWQHVLEPVFGYLQLAAKLFAEPARYAGSWNFGPSGERELSVAEVLQSALSAWGGTASRLVSKPDAGAPPESPALRLDCAKVRGALGWRTRYGADEAVALAVAWYRAQAQAPAFDARAFTLRQIREYSAKVG